jgi:hypothetical protein
MLRQHLLQWFRSTWSIGSNRLAMFFSLSLRQPTSIYT